MTLKLYKLSALSLGAIALSISPVTLAQETASPTNPYPPQAIQAWMSVCVRDDSPEAQVFCQCTIDKIQNRYTIEQFIQLGQNIQSGQKPPEEFNQIVQSCVPQEQ
ncbi:hypothetical protein IQ249_08260 [Lusitaniella coriacea LEGE 07157]|uniref:Uncharacterized protein n=1 Tax=Lusitaniella coriacea LEGE 07157 TaxID=945747 RepID=A0A8J7DVQ0_9CYAN|nr:hypothetical protein [Lusitaniella coriacea]MBE9115883.1 hypothetical protein [Lusitaniella coriacea LEGE 07157]